MFVEKLLFFLETVHRQLWKKIWGKKEVKENTRDCSEALAHRSTGGESHSFLILVKILVCYIDEDPLLYLYVHSI